LPKGVKEMRLSLCMIVKNEERFLRACLESVRDVVDEMIIVDTGSTDETVAIGESFGAQVFREEWKNDFATARNQSIEHATGEWILVMDADERLHEEDQALVRELLTHRDEADGFYINILDYFSVDDVRTFPGVLRLFQNGPLRYKGVVHEDLDFAWLGRTAKLFQSAVRFNHVGYMSAVMDFKEKHERNLVLMKEVVKARPKDAFAMFNLGREYYRMDMWEESCRVLRDAYELIGKKPFSPFFAMGVQLLSQSHLLNGNIQESLRWLREGIRRAPGFTDLPFRVGDIYAQMRNYPEAISYFEKCVALGDTVAYPSRIGVGTHLAACELGAMYRDMGDLETAREWFMRGFEMNQAYAPVVYELATLVSDAETLEALFSMLADTRIQQQFVVGLANACNPHFEVYADDVERRAGRSNVTITARAKWLMGTGRLDDAASMIEFMPGDDAAYMRFLLSVVMGKRDNASSHAVATGKWSEECLTILRVLQEGNDSPEFEGSLSDTTMNYLMITQSKLLLERLLPYLKVECTEATMRGLRRYRLSELATRLTASVASDHDEASAYSAIAEANGEAALRFASHALEEPTVMRYMLLAESYRLLEQPIEMRRTIEKGAKVFPGSLWLRKLTGVH